MKIVGSVSSHELIRSVLRVLIAELSPFNEEYDERRYSIFELRGILIRLFETGVEIRDLVVNVGNVRDELHIEVCYTADGEPITLDIFQRGRHAEIRNEKPKRGCGSR